MNKKIFIASSLLAGMLMLTGCTEEAYEGASAAVQLKSPKPTASAETPAETLGSGEIRIDEYNIQAKCYAGEPCIKTYGDKTTDCTNEVNPEQPNIPANGVNVVYSDIPNTNVLAILCIWRSGPDWDAL